MFKIGDFSRLSRAPVKTLRGDDPVCQDDPTYVTEKQFPVEKIQPVSNTAQPGWVPTRLRPFFTPVHRLSEKIQPGSPYT